MWEGDRWNFRSRVHFKDFKGLCNWIYENGKPLDLFAIQVWSIWNQRNKLRLNHTCCLTKDLQKMTEESWNEIRRSNLRSSRINSSSTSQTTWTAPAPDSYKINFDGALSNADNKSGIGVVVQDCQGEVIASLVQQLAQAYQPMVVEALAACRAVEFGSELGLRRATVEGDSEVVVKALSCKEYGLALYAHLIKDVSLIFKIVILSCEERW